MVERIVDSGAGRLRRARLRNSGHWLAVQYTSSALGSQIALTPKEQITGVTTGLTETCHSHRLLSGIKYAIWSRDLPTPARGATGAFLLSSMNASELPVPAVIGELCGTEEHFLTARQRPHTETGQKAHR